MSARQHTKPHNKLSPGELALHEKQLPHRRFVDFPQVVGKTIERLHFYTATDYHCITLDLQDKTTLNLEIEPGFIIKAQLQQIRKGDINILAEWAGLSSQGNSG